MICSIVVATYNRARVLDETFSSLHAHLKAAHKIGQVEVVAVDNNSTDSTSVVIERWRSEFDHFVHVKELQQGLSFARNAGIDASTGEIVVFLDDDVEVEQDWLQALLAPFADEKIAVVGGKVLPFGAASLPAWLPREYGYLVSVFDPYDTPRYTDKVMGANFAVRRKVFITAGMFDPKLGRKGKKLLGGEEVDLFRRIAVHGFHLLYTPSAVVLHKIQDKLKADYVVDYAYWLGVSEAHLDKGGDAALKYRLKILRSRIFPALVYPLERMIKKSSSSEMKYRIKIQYSKGYINSAREIAVAS